MRCAERTGGGRGTVPTRAVFAEGSCQHVDDSEVRRVPRCIASCKRLAVKRATALVAWLLEDLHACGGAGSGATVA